MCTLGWWVFRHLSLILMCTNFYSVFGCQKLTKKIFFRSDHGKVTGFDKLKKHICIICQILKVVRFSFSIAQKNQAEEYITKIYNMLGFSSRIWYKIGHILPKWPIFQILAIFTIYGQFCTKCTKKTPTCYIFL